MMKATIGYGLVLLLASAAMGMASPAASGQSSDEAPLASAVAGARVSLEQGLRASESKGRPISGKFEMEDGRLQLSLYTSKGGKYSEVIVDHMTGKIGKSEAITSGEDLNAAKAQSAAMAKAKRSLRAAVARAVSANPGSRAVSAVPELKDGRPVAGIKLLQGKAFKTVSEPLD